MTQPPNQPPQGGFGAPQDPQEYGKPPPPAQPPTAGQPGGYPQQPPASAPGYGYPQQPPTPGYGYPQQPPAGNPYTQPTQPYGQPGTGPYAPPGQPQQAPSPYGYPTPPAQPSYPGAPGGHGGGGRGPFKGKPAVIIGAAVAVLLVAGGVVWAVTGNGDDKPAKPVAGNTGPQQPSASAPVNPGDGSGNGGGDDGNDPRSLNAHRQPGEDKVLWFKSAPDAPGAGADAPGMWINGKVAVKAAYKQVLAYDVADGNPAWQPITLPQAICAATKQATADGKIVVAYKDGLKDTAKCNQLVEIDLNTGKKGWTRQLTEGALFDSTLTVEMSIAQNTLIVGRSQSGAAFRMSDGSPMWEKKEEQDGVCFPGSFTGGTHVIVSLSCAAGQATEHDRVEELNPASGNTLWTKDLPKGWHLSKVYSTDPVVLYMTDQDKTHWNITTLKNGSSETRSQVSVNESFAPDCGFSFLGADLQGCLGTAADANTLYLPTEAKSGANDIVAIDLNTGKEAWRVKAPGGTSMLPMKVESGALIAYEEPSFEKGGMVLSIPLGGGHQPKTLLQNPQSAAQIENGFFSKAIDYVDGRFYISTTRLSGNDKAQEKLMMAFGN